MKSKMKSVMVMVVVVQILYSGMNGLCKLVAQEGMNLTILVAYRLIFAPSAMISPALIFERDNTTKLTRMVLFQAFLCGLFGMEKFSIRTNAGKTKILGMVMGLGGAMLFSFYKGIEINIWSTNVNLLHNHGQQNKASHKSFGSILSGFMLFLGRCVSYALWLIIQVTFLYFL
ncbi:hypothetical protein PRUPE_7G118800 [Prunus persica]|uniref:WAT1-related protein n=1 Tax=Prunus persica TaxID=3760 RepID=A0A251NDE0_PRUPE|nr:hypothetical protein PRUPE_7G118800 [Prunus persica]